MKPALARLAVLAATAAAVVSACAVADPFRVLDEERVVERVAVAPDSVSGAVGDTVRLTGTAIGRDGLTIREAEFTWSSGDPSVVRSVGDGRFVVVSIGTAEMFATSRGRRGVARFVAR